MHSPHLTAPWSWQEPTSTSTTHLLSVQLLLVLLSQSSFCAVSYSPFSSLLSHPSYLLFSFQHFNRTTYTFAPAWCLLCSTGILHWGFSSFLFLTFTSPVLPLVSLNIYFPLSGCLSLSCSLFRYHLLSEMLLKDFNSLNIQDPDLLFL